MLKVKNANPGRYVDGGGVPYRERIGRKPVDQVDSIHVVEVLTPICLEIPDTIRKGSQRIRAVLDFAHQKEWREEEAALRSVCKG